MSGHRGGRRLEQALQQRLSPECPAPAAMARIWNLSTLKLLGTLVTPVFIHDFAIFFIYMNSSLNSSLNSYVMKSSI